MPESSWELTGVLVVLIGALAYISGRVHSYFAMRKKLDNHHKLKKAVRYLYEATEKDEWQSTNAPCRSHRRARQSVRPKPPSVTNYFLAFNPSPKNLSCTNIPRYKLT